MPTATRRLEFDAGHRVLKHESKCKHLHGHRYVAEITVNNPSDGLDEKGRVIDFGVLKTIVGAWIDENWDHNLLLHPQDPVAQLWKIPHLDSELKSMLGGQCIFGGKKPFIFPEGTNPTAENIAIQLFYVAQELLNNAGHSKIRVLKIRVYETPNCWADHCVE